MTLIMMTYNCPNVLSRLLYASTSQSYDGNDDDYSVSPSTLYSSPILIDDDQMNDDDQTEGATISVEPFQ